MYVWTVRHSLPCRHIHQFISKDISKLLLEASAESVFNHIVSTDEMTCRACTCL